jgi:hypothetical protein
MRTICWRDDSAPDCFVLTPLAFDPPVDVGVRHVTQELACVGSVSLGLLGYLLGGQSVRPHVQQRPDLFGRVCSHLNALTNAAKLAAVSPNGIFSMACASRSLKSSCLTAGMHPCFEQ